MLGRFCSQLVLEPPDCTPEGYTKLRNRPCSFLGRSVAETLHGHSLAVCHRAGFIPELVQEASELFVILNQARAGLGVSLVPGCALPMPVPRVHFHELRMLEMQWCTDSAWNKSSEKRKLISRFCETISAAVKDP